MDAGEFDHLPTMREGAGTAVVGADRAFLHRHCRADLKPDDATAGGIMSISRGPPHLSV